LVNVETVLAEKNRTSLPRKSLDLIFIRNVCHHLRKRVEYFEKLKDSLKPEGRIAIIEYRSAGRFSFREIFGHYVPKDTIIKEMKEAGYQLEKDLDFLSEQSFTIFS
jgi:SAM-dependent methyltransferase